MCELSATCIVGLYTQYQSKLDYDLILNQTRAVVLCTVGVTLPLESNSKFNMEFLAGYDSDEESESDEEQCLEQESKQSKLIVKL